MQILLRLERTSGRDNYDMRNKPATPKYLRYIIGVLKYSYIYGRVSPLIWTFAIFFICKPDDSFSVHLCDSTPLICTNYKLYLRP